jgi:hypothetical protein
LQLAWAAQGLIGVFEALTQLATGFADGNLTEEIVYGLEFSESNSSHFFEGDWVGRCRVDVVKTGQYVD